MLTYEEAKTLTGHGVMIDDGKRNRHMPGRLIRVVNEYTAHVKPGHGHGKIETISLRDLCRHEKSIFESEQRRISQERNRNGGTVEPDEATDVVHLVVDTKGQRFWSANDGEHGQFVPELAKARLFESWAKARIARGRIVWGKRHEDMNPVDVEVLTAEKAREMAIRWNKLTDDEIPALPTPAVVEPEVLEQPAEVIKPDKVTTTTTTTVGPIVVAQPNRAHEPKPEPVEPKEKWITLGDLCVEARPKTGIRGPCIMAWAEAGKMPSGVMKNLRPGYKRGSYMFNIAKLRTSGWLAEQNRIDDELAKLAKGGKKPLGRPPGKLAIRTANADPDAVAPLPPKHHDKLPEVPREKAKVPPGGAREQMAKAINDIAEYEALALEIQAEKLRAQAAKIRAQARIEVEAL